jgi:hypothetical protein
MRFGAALDLWHKGDLHKDDDELPAPKQAQVKDKPSAKSYLSSDDIVRIGDALDEAGLSLGDIFKAAKVNALDEIESSRLEGLLKWISTNKKDAE